MVVVCKYDDCGYQQKMTTNNISEECPKCCGHWLEEGEDYEIKEFDGTPVLVGCSLTYSRGGLRQDFNLTDGRRICGRKDFAFIGNHDAYISGTHFLLVIEDGHLFVEDLTSTNGTFIGLVDKSPVSGRMLLSDGAWLVLGREEFLVGYLYEQLLPSPVVQAEGEPVNVQPYCVE
jgi:Zn-finger nucleic acid-binding protein